LYDKYKRLDRYDKKVAEIGIAAILVVALWLLTVTGNFNPVLAIILLLSIMVYMWLPTKWGGQREDETESLR
jgi:Ca2+/Na+ antiporter